MWPEPVTSEHAGRLELWVGRADISKAKPAPWPWLRTGGGDVFAPLPFGTDPRGRRVDGAVIEHNWLLGSMPGQGKTSAVRVLVGAAALDPTAEMWMHELKGTGDLDPFEQVSHRFVSGIDDESIAYAAESLKLLRAEVMHRAARLKKLAPRAVPGQEGHPGDREPAQPAPVAAAGRVRRGAEPVRPPEVRQAGRRGRRVHHQDRPGARRVPDPGHAAAGQGLACRPACRGNVSTRFCLKVAGQVENDMILGTSAYKNGARATTFRPKVDAGLGYLKGEENVPQVVPRWRPEPAGRSEVHHFHHVIHHGQVPGPVTATATRAQVPAPARKVIPGRARRAIEAPRKSLAATAREAITSRRQP